MRAHLAAAFAVLHSFSLHASTLSEADTEAGNRPQTLYYYWESVEWTTISQKSDFSLCSDRTDGSTFKLTADR